MPYKFVEETKPSYRFVESDEQSKASTVEQPKARTVNDDLRDLVKEEGWLGRNLAGFGTAATDLLLSGKQMVTGTLSPEDERLRTANKVMAEEAPVGSIAGNVAVAAPLAFAMPGALAPALGTRMLSGGVTGAATSILQPVDPSKDLWTEKGKQAALGTVVGGVAPAIVGGAARVISPKTRPEARLLMDEGVTTTPGQILGGAAQRLEEGLTSIPFLGDAIKSSQRRTVEDFNRAAINKSLEPIGQKLNMKTTMGNDAISEAGEKISTAYDDLLPKLTVKADPQFVQEMTAFQSVISTLPEAQAKQLKTILRTKVIEQFDQTGSMAGETMKQADSELKRFARNYRGSPDPDQRMMADALSEAQSYLRGMVTRNNPQHADQLQGIDKAYSTLLRVENAAARVGSKEGVFSPAALRGGVRAMDTSMRKRAFARGKAPMQEFADAAENVLGPKVPDSGSPFRAASGLTALGGWMLDPSIPVSIGIGSAMYTKPVQKAITGLLTQRPELAGPISEALRRLSPASAAALPALYDKATK